MESARRPRRYSKGWVWRRKRKGPKPAFQGVGAWYTRSGDFSSLSCAASRRHQDQQGRPRGQVRGAGRETAGIGIGGLTPASASSAAPRPPSPPIGAPPRRASAQESIEKLAEL